MPSKPPAPQLRSPSRVLDTLLEIAALERTVDTDSHKNCEFGECACCFAETVLASYRRILEERDVARDELDALRADLAAATRDMPMAVPEPGTVEHRLFIANRLLRAEIHALKTAAAAPSPKRRAAGARPRKP